MWLKGLNNDWLYPEFISTHSMKVSRQSPSLHFFIIFRSLCSRHRNSWNDHSGLSHSIRHSCMSSTEVPPSSSSPLSSLPFQGFPIFDRSSLCCLWMGKYGTQSVHSLSSLFSISIMFRISQSTTSCTRSNYWSSCVYEFIQDIWIIIEVKSLDGT